MTKRIWYVFAVLLIMAACANEQVQPKDEGNKVDFVVAKNYFFRNGQTIPENPKVTRAEDFERLFGMATFLGDDGVPTTIDFAKQFVLVIVLPVTDIETEIIPKKVTEKGNSLYYTYTIKTGGQQSFHSQPLSIIILDRQYAERNVILMKES